mmetsp:Transcript_5926/g.14665  ORF Transcript_5926/g.14665 Transcript_5926/m.14665 type:complete len:377 (+) Transcript_5926:58-1188(+)
MSTVGAARAAGCVLQPGMTVRLFNLKTAATLNGQEGVCEYWDATACRMHVRLKKSGELKALKPSNLRKVHVEVATQNAEAARVKQIFRKYDSNGDGVFDIEEFKKFLYALGLNVSCLDAFLRKVDKNDDGAVQYEEFVDWVLGDDPLPSVDVPAGKSIDRRPSQLAEAAPVDDSDSDDDDDPPETKDLTLQELTQQCGELPYGWPPNGIKIVNNMRRRFPDYPVQRIVHAMKQHNFHGGEVMQAIRRAGATEVDVVPPSIITKGKSGRSAFPALYRARPEKGELLVYEQAGADFSFQNMRKGRLQSAGSIRSGEKFRIMEVRRDNERGFCFGRVYFGTSASRPHWVDLGRESDRATRTSLKGSDLQFPAAERLDPA